MESRLLFVHFRSLQTTFSPKNLKTSMVFELGSLEYKTNRLTARPTSTAPNNYRCLPCSRQ